MAIPKHRVGNTPEWTDKGKPGLGTNEFKGIRMNEKQGKLAPACVNHERLKMVKIRRDGKVVRRKS